VTKEEIDEKLLQLHLLLGVVVRHVALAVLFWNVWRWKGVGLYWLASATTSIPVRILKRIAYKRNGVEE
jgi:hypothetical protein